MQNKLYRMQFFLTTWWPICSASPSTDRRTCRFHGFSQNAQKYL